MMNLDWNKVKENVRVFDTIEYGELRTWRTFVKNYRKVQSDFGFEVMIMDSITMIEDSRTKLKNRLMELARFNQKEGITAIYVCQRSTDDPDSYSVAGGIGLPHNFDINICVDRMKVGNDLRKTMNATRPKENQLAQWQVIHFVRMMGCRLCGFDRNYFEVDIENGFLIVKRCEKMVKINELRDNDRKIDIEVEIIEKSETREVKSRFTNEQYKVADVTAKDETGTINIPLWNDQIPQVRVGDRIKIENGYVKSFREVLSLNVGKYGKLTVL